MNSELLFDDKTYVSVSKASRKLGYTADYIGQLCRAGKIDAKMIGRTWYVEWGSMLKHKKSKLHRVRRTAEEIRNAKSGVTSTVYILDEELKEVPPTNNTNETEVEITYALPKTLDEDCPPEEYLKNLDKENISDVKQESVTPSPVVAAFESPEINSIVNSSPDDCPQEEYLKKIDEENISRENNPVIPEEWLPKLIKKDAAIISPYVVSVEKYSPKYANKIASIFIFIFVFTTASSWLSFTKPRFVQTAVIPQIQNIQNATATLFNPNGNQFASIPTSDTGDSGNSKNLSSVIGSIKDGFGFVLNGLKSKINHLALIYMKSLGFVPESSLPYASNPSRIGLVVVPDDPNHDATVATIKNSFSDQVDVRQDQDPSSGVIVPQFKTTKDTAYTYVMVPINSP